MRKNLYLGLIACAALTMTGCSNDEVSYDSSKQEAQPIQFSTYLGKNVQGRAQELGGTGKALKNFGVFASYKAGAGWSADNTMNFMWNQEVTYNSETPAWEYTPLKYWPETNGEQISFFAYAPYTNYETSPANSITPPADKTTSGAPVLGFSISNDVKRMVDFTAGVVMNRAKQNADDPAVSFTLKHELARVNFAAKLDRDAFKDDNAANKTKVNIKSIKLLAGGDFNLKADYTFATTDGTLGTWSNLNPTTENLDVTPIMKTATPNVGDLGGYTTPGVLVPTKDPVQLFQTGQYLFLIPNSSESTRDVTVEIEYDIVTVDGALSAGHVVSSATKQVTIEGKQFEQGKAKKYVFEIGLHEIKVAAEVENWATETAGTETTVNGTDIDA